ncbi:adenine nucleotide alpha hydrolase family protein [Enterovibrio norvegicus]|uniref:hypothetical protein n=1 Tax=Enterovibrio norvegicus TaxID=188144 RepID=UPI000C862704|nr:hypothetical protein [Enterovibrio norvegicus]PMH64492.1 hypothetical protein BCU62_15675 [Enterovibrio norvegicus]
MKKVTSTFRHLMHKPADDEFMKLANELVDLYIPDWDFDIQPDPNAINFIGISGGVDSSALAAVLLCKHPDIDWHLFFSDTGNEPEEVNSIISVFSEMMGARVTIGYPVRGLLESIEVNGYLPSARQRWCTAQLKIKVWEDYLSKLLENPESVCVNYSGIRFDERDRVGILGIDRVMSSHPFVNQRVERRAVVKIAQGLELLGGSYFRGKSRSGCMNCFFQAKQELISLAIWDPVQFEKGAKAEKLNDSILDVLDDSNHPIEDKGYYCGYPLSNMSIEGKQSLIIDTLLGESRSDNSGVNWNYLFTRKPAPKKKAMNNDAQTSMFEDVVEAPVEQQEYVDLYVAIEHLIHPLMRESNLGVYSQLPISYSTTLSGLSRSIGGYMYHRRTLADAFFNSEKDYEEQSHVTVLCLRFPRSVLPIVDYNQPGVYTWSSGTSYLEISHTLRAINRLSHYLFSLQMIELSEKHRIDGITLKESRKFVETVKCSGVELGQLIGIGHFKPKQSMQDLRDDSYDENPKTVRCIACSI